MTGGIERRDRLKVLPRLLLTLFLLVAPLLIVTPAAAQEKGTFIISAPEVNSFPTIRFRLDAFDSQGAFVNNLKDEDVQIVEDGQTLKAETFDKTRSDLQTIIALNTSPAMANQTSGVSGYKLVQTALIDWAKGQSAQTADDYSFSTPTGLFLIREHDPALLVKALTDYQPDLIKTQPSLGSLAEALDLATDPLDRTAMKRAILYITPPLPADTSVTLSDLSNRATKVGVRINVWQISPSAPAASTPKSPNPLELLAQETGGQYQVILPNASLPEIEPLFQPLRDTYQISYTSAIQKSGQHTVSVKIGKAQSAAESNQNSFNLTVQPPNPIFLSPPASIERSWVSSTKNAPAALSPSEVPLQIVIEFPDQHHRALKATRLYANDKLIQENTSEPFDRFIWPVDNLTVPTRQMLRVEAVDVLNISGSSEETPVDILIDQPAKTSLMSQISGRGMIAIASVAAAGGVLALVLILTGNQRRTRQNQSAIDKKRRKDPVTQPVNISQDHARPLKGKGQKQDSKAFASASTSKPASGWPVPSWPRPGNQNAPARLVTLDENEQPITGGALYLARQEITFGKDPRRATQLLESPTVDDLHARLYRDPDGNFYLADQGSVAGTWINYAPVTANGARLEHGDLIHIGKVMFRFELTDQARVSAAEIKVTDLEM